jgi:glucose/mannose transport system permease protein
MTRPKLYLALSPALLIVVVAYVGTLIWTVGLSLTDSRLFPSWRFVGLVQYERLFAAERWRISLTNMALIGVLTIVGSLVIGFLLAVALDRRMRAEGVLRTLFLYPFAMSFVVTGVAWSWLLNPDLGVQQAVRNLGWTDFRFDWIIHEQTAVLCIAIAALWQSSGLVMVLMLAGMRGIDAELWKAARIDNIPVWRFYLHVVLPMLGPSVASAVVLLGLNVVKMYDLVVALTDGGPGMSSEVPAKFVMEYLFNRQNIGFACAGATVLLLIVVLLLGIVRGFSWLMQRRQVRA